MVLSVLEPTGSEEEVLRGLAIRGTQTSSHIYYEHIEVTPHLFVFWVDLVWDFGICIDCRSGFVLGFVFLPGLGFGFFCVLPGLDFGFFCFCCRLSIDLWPCG